MLRNYYCGIIIFFISGMIYPQSFNSSLDSKNDLETNKSNFFYNHYDYGNEILYSPLYIIANRGFDMTQVTNRDVKSIDYQSNFKNVWNNLMHPIEAIEDYGWDKFIKREIFPMNFTFEGRWIPNYSLHLVGGGITYRMLQEWGEYHQLSFPKLTAAATVILSAFVNETIENNDSTGRNTDAIADFYFFDLPGILLFSSDAVARFFSEKLKIHDWSLQPSITAPDFYLHNNGQHYSIKLDLPYVENIKLFNYFGLESFWGLSYNYDQEHSISIGGGFGAAGLVKLESDPNQNTIYTKHGFGVFWDRNDSLLASIIVADVADYFILANLFPGVLKFKDFALGSWLVMDREFRPGFGITSNVTLGLGTGYTKNNFN